MKLHIENAPQTERFLKNISAGSQSRRIPVELKEGEKTYDRPWFDLYMFGRTIGRIFGFEDETSEERNRLRKCFLDKVLSPDNVDAPIAKQFFKLIVDRLILSIEIEESKRYYRDAQEVMDDLRKLLNQFGDAHDVKELYPFSRRVIRIPVTRNTECSARIEKLIDCGPVKRLKKHRQLALTYHVYPGVRHVRHEHTLGIVGKTLDYVRALYADKSSVYFRILMDSMHVRALIFAAAVHDVGHGAFGHYLEECEALFTKCSHEDYIQAVLRRKQALYGATIPKEVLKNDRKALLKCAQVWMEDLRSRKRLRVDRFLKLVADILKPPKILNPLQSLNLLTHEDTELALRYILSSIIDSTIDADKLDYLKRDAHHGGLDYAWATDNDRFFQSLTTVLSPPKKSEEKAGDVNTLEPQLPEAENYPTVAVTTKGVEPVECLLVARYQMFRAMYWHKKARAATAVLLQMVFRYFQLHIAKEGVGKVLEYREILLSEFRQRDDDGSIIWLRDELLKLTNLNVEQEGVVKLAMAILERQDLPIRICETSYSRCAPKDRERYQRILELHLWLHRREITDYCWNWSRILLKTMQSIHEKIDSPTNESPQDLYSEIFLDVPLDRSSDKVRNLYVVAGEGDAAHVEPFDTYSVMGKAITDAFGIWAKQLRVFASPELAKIINKQGKSTEEVNALVFDSVYSAYTEVFEEYNKKMLGKKA